MLSAKKKFHARLTRRARKAKKRSQGARQSFSAFAPSRGISLRLCVEIHNVKVNDIELVAH
jgi:hypothetical protein